MATTNSQGLVLGETGHCNICPEAAKAQQTSRVTPSPVEGPGCSKISELAGRGGAGLEVLGRSHLLIYAPF